MHHVYFNFSTVEANVTHKGRSKPMLWEMLRETKRFAFAKSGKVEHVPLFHNGSSDDMW